MGAIRNFIFGANAWNAKKSESGDSQYEKVTGAKSSSEAAYEKATGATRTATKAENTAAKHTGNPASRIISGFSMMGGDIASGKGPAADFFGGMGGGSNRGGPPNLDMPSFMGGSGNTSNRKSKTHKKKAKGLKPAFYDPASGRTYVAKGKSHKSKKKRDNGPDTDMPDFI